jgi:Rrf2 family protein
MRLPAKIDYAYRAVLELSLRYNQGVPVRVNIISEAQGIPGKFLVQLLLKLKNANIVDSSRGISGGYRLTRPPSQISLADVTRAIDDSIIEVPKVTRPVKVSDAGKAITRIWSDIAKDTARRLEDATFDKLMAQINNQQIAYQI